MQVPFFRPEIKNEEIDEVVSTLRSGWLTTGPRVNRFEKDLAESVRAEHAIAVNSCTAALHLAVEALNLQPGQAVLIPTMTFAATAEVIRYMGAIPVLVDCDPVTFNMNLEDAERKLNLLNEGRLFGLSSIAVGRETKVVGMIPVHVGGLMMDITAIQNFAKRHQLWVIEDAAHALPAAWRPLADAEWQQCGQGTADVTCFSFYANKTITTGEGGMAVTNDENLAERMRLMSLHGLSRDAWTRYSTGGTWDYKIVAPGFKYNLTDIAAAIGIHQLARAEEMRLERESIARLYGEMLAGVAGVDLPAEDANRVRSWHLYPIKLRLEQLTIDRNTYMEEMKNSGVMCSVHWRPLHLHPYYEENFGWKTDELPIATDVWQRLISLPLFSGMRHSEVEHVAKTVRDLCELYAR